MFRRPQRRLWSSLSAQPLRPAIETLLRDAIAHDLTLVTRMRNESWNSLRWRLLNSWPGKREPRNRAGAPSLDTSHRLRDACCLGILPICVSRLCPLRAFREFGLRGMSGGPGGFPAWHLLRFAWPHLLHSCAPAPEAAPGTYASPGQPPEAARRGAEHLMEEGILCSLNLPLFS